MESIVEPIAVFPDVGSSPGTCYFEILPRKKWADTFVEWLRQPYDVEIQEMLDEEDAH